jgi:hypothetical protein
MKKLALFAAALVIAGTANAEVQSDSGPFTVELDALDAFDCEGETKWEQLPNGGTGASSQDDVCYPFESNTADNFVGDGTDMIGVGWWGVYWNGTPIPPDAFNIEIYADNGGLPGALLAETSTTDYNETVGSPNGYCSQIDTFSKADGVTYHLSIQASFCFPPQWGWSSGDGDGLQGSFRGALFGFPDWVSATTVFGVPYEFSMVLYNGDGPPVPTEEKTWSGIKSLYQF